MSKRNTERRTTNAAEPTPAGKPGGTGRRVWPLLLVCLVASGAITFVIFKFFVFDVPNELIGTWQVTDGGLRGATLEFRPDGTATAILTRQGKKEATHSSVKVVGKTIYLTDRDERGKQETVTQTILSLEEDKLVIRDEDGNVYRMKRLKN
jgi:uncharacterized protein (TIGR03066 family)